MDAFDQENGARLQLEFLAVELPESSNEVIFRHIHCLAGKQFHHVALKILMVYCVEIVEVKRAVRKTRSVKTVYKIVIGRE